MKKIIHSLSVGIVTYATALAQIPETGSNIVDNNVLFDVTFDNNTSNDQSSYNAAGQPSFVYIYDGLASFKQTSTFQPVSSNISYGSLGHLNNNNNFTISVWYSGGTSNISDKEILFQMNDLEIGIHDLNTPFISTNTNQIWDNSWNANAYDHNSKMYKEGYTSQDKQHLVLVKTGNTLSFYRNNVLKGIGEYTVNPNASQEIKIGSNFEGIIDRVTVYENALSEQEMQDLFFYNPSLPISNTCDESLEFEPFRIIYGEGNKLHSCYTTSVDGNERGFGEVVLFKDRKSYTQFEGTSYLTLPDGGLVIRNNRIEFNQFGQYQLKFVTNDNCVYNQEIDFLPSPAKPEIWIESGKNILCKGNDIFLKYNLKNPYVQSNINGESAIAKQIIKNLDKNLIVDEFESQRSLDSLLITTTGTYVLYTDYKTCANPDYKSYSVDVIENPEYCQSIINSTENILNNAASIHPNPTKGKLFLENVTNIDYIEIYNLSGEKVLIPDPTNIDISSLEKGVYILKINADNILSAQKIVLE
jgi:hypothetical protein